MKTILQIRINWDYNEDEKIEYVSFLQKELLRLNNNEKLESLLLRNADDEKYSFLNNFSFKVLDKSNDIELIEIYRKHFKKDNGDIFLEISFDLNKEYDLIFLEFTVDSILERLILILNLTYNFPIDFLESLTINDKNEVCNISKVILSDLQLSYQHSQNIKWPELEGVTIDETIESFAFNNYSLEGISKNDYQRSINAFSHIFFNLFEKDSDILFWNMVGIEALLAKGNKDIQSQIKEKSILILGEQTEFKKKITNLYSYRSKFVHGELNFPAKFSSDENFFNEEYWEYSSFSTAIHLALLRHLIKSKKTEFTFEYKYVL